MRLLRHSYLAFYALFVLSCARQTTPTGGPRDTIPPTLLQAIPQQGTVNFKGKTIQLTFSEAVILNNPRDQIIITPDLGEPVNARVKKNQVIVELEKDLSPNTTYAINFRESVQDITEKNPAQNLKLAFSTGTYIDSLSIGGTVMDALTTKESKDATVALFQSDTFNIFVYRPTYFTKADAKGHFKIENLKPGNYYLYAFDDKNKNLVADSKTESYGFIQELLQLTDNIDSMRVPLVRLDSRPLVITGARPSGTFFNIKTAKNLDSYTIRANDAQPIISSFGEDFANIRVYNTFNGTDSVGVNFVATDSIQHTVDTTLYVKFQERVTKPEPFQFEMQELQVIGAKGIIRGNLQFNKPVIAVNYDSIYYRLDSTTVIPFTDENIHWDSLRNKMYFQKTFDRNLIPKPPTGTTQQRPRANTITPGSDQKKSVSNEFFLGAAAFISIEKDSSRRLIEKSAPTKLEETGVLLVEVQTNAPHFFVQLLNKEYKVLASRRNAKKFNFEDLKPGDYLLRLVIDTDDNGKWDPGNFYDNRPAESISFYLNEKHIPIISLKANWELGPLLIKD
jgi:uncharacterized protein (DUF2141 family)